MKVLPSYTIVLHFVEFKLIVPASSNIKSAITRTMSSIRGCECQDHEVIVMHVTVMCSDKKTCAYQAATTHFTFHRSPTWPTASSSLRWQTSESRSDGRV